MQPSSSEPSLSPEQVLDCLEAIALCIRQTQSLDQILNTAAKEVRKLLQTDRVLVYRFQPDGSGVVVVESVGSGWTPILNQTIHDPCFEITWAEPYRQGRISAIADIYTSDIQPCYVEFLAQFQVRANLVVPLKQGENLWGLLIAHHCSSARHWQPLEVNLLQQLAVQMSVAIQLTELYQQAQTELQERKEAQAKLQASEQFLRTLYEGALNSIFVVDVLQIENSEVTNQELEETNQGKPAFLNSSIKSPILTPDSCLLTPSYQFRFAGLNPAHEQLTGLRSEDIQGKSPEQVLSPAAAAAVCANYARCVQAGTPISYEECLPFKDEESWWFTTLTPLFDAQSRIYRLIGSSINITERKQVEQDLKIQQEFLRNVIDTNPNLICVKDWDGRFRLVNQALADIYGTTVENLTGKTDADFSPTPAEVEQYLQDDRQVMCTLQPKFIAEETLSDATGEVHYLQTIKKPLLSTDGKIRYVLATATDITARKRAEQERDCFFQQLEQQNQILEAKVQERTAQLRQTNEQLLIEIRERQRLTAQVEQQARTLDTVLCASPDEIYMIDRAGRFLYVNRASLQPMSALLHGQEPVQLSEIVGKTGHELGFPPELIESHEARMESVFVTGQPLGGETSYLLENEIRYQEYTLTPIYDLDGGVEAVVITNRDISDRKRVEEELRKSEERWQLVLKGNNDGIWDLDLKTNKVFRSARWMEILGYLDHELSNDNDEWATRIHLDDFERVMQANQDYWDRKIPHYAVEYRLRCKDGSYKWVLGRAQAVWDEAGNPVRMVGSTTDISDRKRAEEALRESEKQFRQIFQEAPIGISVTDFQTHQFLQANPAWCQLLGYSVSELISLTFDEITHPDDLPNDLYYIEQIAQGKIDSFCIEKRYRKKNGEFMWVNLTVTVLPHQNGRPKLNLAMIEDITERRQLQIDLLHSEERFRTSIENMLDGFGIYTAIRDESGEIVDFLIEYVNAAACQNNRLTKEEQIGQRLCEVLPTHCETGLFDEYCQVVEAGQPLVKESLLYEDISKEQQLSRAFDIRVVKFGDGFAAAWRDVTSRKQAEDQIKASLVEKETLLQEIHHRVKNNLQVISSLLRLQSRQIRDQQALELFKESQNRVQAMALIHEKLYQSSNLAFIDFQEYITSLVGNLCRSYDIYRHAITFKVNVNQVSLAIDTAIPCGLIINELVTNSLKYAFPDNRDGEISISLESMHSGQFVLTISDNGVGLPENLDFRNTSSLGLQLVCRLCKQLEGRIELNQNQGTEFKITFTNAKS